VASIDEEVFDAVYEKLLPHASYISKGKGDQARYFIPPEVAEALVWIICNVVVPIFTGVGTSIISDRLKAMKKGKKEEVRALGITASDLSVVQREVHETALSPDSQRPSIDLLLRARDDVEAVLLQNGFPASVATTAAHEAIDAVVETTWKESDSHD